MRTLPPIFAHHDFRTRRDHHIHGDARRHWGGFHAARIEKIQMRNGQQKRMRGRNNRRGSNPLTRVYESNGPDVKVRGTAHHITEKYQQLARDAQSSGDPVAAENYLQHAEHYLRLIASLQGQFTPQLGFGRDDDMDDEDMDDVGGLDAPQPFSRQEQYAPRETREPREAREARDGREQRESREPREPRDTREPREAREPRDTRESRDSREPRDTRESRDTREPREGREPREAREPRAEGRTSREGRNFRRTREEEGAEPREYRASRTPREDAGEGAGYAPAPAPRPARSSRSRDEAEAAPRAPRAERAEEDHDIGLPAFITGTPAVTKEVRVEPKAEGEEPMAADDATDAGDGRVTRRRRRFRTRAERAEETGAGDAPAPEQQVLFGE
ncbi:DUF4167 domain-containing protein [Xanthobacter agilis]|uniref:DUF4167 domain-containing protein n=1 Tax=Xanthobacter agilis TaxID=47492 RepID=A0ABU0L9L9_XANAG|nr:DUF4167 domain-containing protein [Xanthobacter agilis]MDQ0503824.1 hypothetical protein [Xanthobacter agilis]